MSIYQWPLLFMTRRQICESTEQDSIERKVAFNICCPLTIIKYTLKKKKNIIACMQENAAMLRG